MLLLYNHAIMIVFLCHRLTKFYLLFFRTFLLYHSPQWAELEKREAALAERTTNLEKRAADVNEAIRLTKAETKKERKRLAKVEEELIAKEAALKERCLKLDAFETDLKQKDAENHRQMETIASERSKLEASTEKSHEEVRAARVQLDECVLLRVEEEQRYTEAKAGRQLEEAKRDKLIQDAERAKKSIKATVSVQSDTTYMTLFATCTLELFSLSIHISLLRLIDSIDIKCARRTR